MYIILPKYEIFTNHNVWEVMLYFSFNYVWQNCSGFPLETQTTTGNKRVINHPPHPPSKVKQLHFNHNTKIDDSNLYFLINVSKLTFWDYYLLLAWQLMKFSGMLCTPLNIFPFCSVPLCVTLTSQEYIPERMFFLSLLNNG